MIQVKLEQSKLEDCIEFYEFHIFRKIILTEQWPSWKWALVFSYIVFAYNIIFGADAYALQPVDHT